MNYWLFKTEPDVYSIDDLRRAGASGDKWDGIRNYQARNFLRDGVAVGDRVFIYHSSCKQVGIAGVAEVCRAAYPDPAQFDPESTTFDPKASVEAPRWFNVDLKFVEAFPRTLLLSSLKANPHLSDMVLIRQGRLSVQPVTADEWQAIVAMVN